VLSKNLRKKGGKSEWRVQETEEIYTNFSATRSNNAIILLHKNIETTLVLDDGEFQKQIMVSEHTKTHNYYVWLEGSPKRKLRAPCKVY
jgi:hypothetical protein